MVDKYIIIFNPTAGKGLAKKKLPIIEKFLIKKNVKYKIIETHFMGHAEQIAESYSNEKDTAVIAAGGDGTCNEVINGLMKGKKEFAPIFGVLPIGRGNDFSYGGHIPSRLEEALEILLLGNTSYLDVGLIKGGNYPNGRYFGNGIGIGFDTVVGLEAAKMKYLHGAFAYVAGTIKTLIKFQDSPEIEINYSDTKLKLEAIQISIMNGTRMGGLFYMAPEAVNNDGWLDLCVVKHINRRKLINAVSHYLKGTQKGLEGIIMDRSNLFNIKALSGKLIVHADGEIICTDGKELTITCLEKPIRIIHK